MAGLLLGGAKILCGLGLWLGSAAWNVSSPNLFFGWFYLVQLGVFCIAAAVLVLGGRADVRARALGANLLLFGSVFVDPFIRQATPQLQGASSTFATVLYNFEPIALAPAYLWQFARQFPRPLAEWPWPVSPRMLVTVSFAFGWVAVACNLVLPFTAPDTWPFVITSQFSGRNESGHLWELLTALSLPVFVLIFANLRASPEVERRRVRLFLAGLIAGVAPISLDIILAVLVPSYRNYSRDPARIRYVGVGLSLALLLVPVGTVYAILVNRVFDVSFFVRRAIQYALARYTLVAVLAIPGVALASYVYTNRDQSIADLLGEQPVVGWVLVVATMLAIALLRRPLLEMLDRAFFREHYDTRRILLALVDGSRRAGTRHEQAALTVREIDRALHVVTVSMFVRDADGRTYADPQHNHSSLSCESELAHLIGGASTPLDASAAKPTLGRLPASDQDWLSEVGARLFVPLLASDESLLGIIAVGEKLSEAPFSAEDRDLLTSVAISAALALEHRLLLESTSPDKPPGHADTSREQPARQCSWCGVLQPDDEGTCRRCGGPLVTARLPPVLAGTFAVERQIGRGGMGVVYRGRDLTLDRLVALKTLPRASASSVNRLRQEALAMAALEDPHFAIIYGAETWRGCPVLILEYLAGGTLADRLTSGPIAVDEVVNLGLAMSNALDALHRSGLLHGDIKPSNIGYTATGVPKLLDFGLARLVSNSSMIVAASGSSAVVDVSAHEPVPLAASSAVASASETVTRFARTVSNHIAGTAAYLSPGAIALERPGAKFDLWSLAVTLFEALTGQNPFRGADLAETLSLIGLARLPEPRSLRADCPPTLATFLQTALARRAQDRPASARAFHAALSRCR